MQRTPFSIGRAVAVSSAVIVSTAAPAAFAYDGVAIGRDSAGHLHTHMHESTFIVPFSVFVDAPGWAFGRVGFESADHNEPEEDFYILDPSANIEAVLLACDAGANVWNSGSPMSVGDAILLGQPFFDFHPLWQIEEGPSGASFEITFYVRDLSGLYGPSEPFTLTFIAAYCDADFDTSGFVDLDDFIAFVAAFELGGDDADFDDSGFVDLDDFADFVLAFEAGC